MDPSVYQAMERLQLVTELDTNKYGSLLEVYAEAIARFGDKPCYSSLGHTISFREFGQLAEDFAAYLQHHSTLEPGDRIAIQLPNLIQYPVLTYGAMLAGMVVVNTNPLYTERELKHQLNDSGAKLLVVLASVAATAEKVIADTAVQQVLVAGLADFHPWPKRLLIHSVARYVKKILPKVSIAGALTLGRAMSQGASKSFRPVAVSADQLAVLQYTGGTTGVAKGAMLSHRNLIANLMQCGSLFSSFHLREGEETVVLPLPMYHIYSFTLGVVMMELGNHCVLVPNPRDLSTVVGAIERYGLSFFCGINTLFVALCNHEDFKNLDLSDLRVTLSGGMALTEDAERQWRETTGCPVIQGYGLTETAPVISSNVIDDNRPTTIGLPVAGTELVCLDDDGRRVPVGERGELCMRGPQLMMGYWQRPEATAEVIDDQGWFHTGDIGVLDEHGFHRIVDRKKDMVLVSGFNVYPNELDAVLSEHPGVLECAAVGVPDERSGEAVKMHVVLSDSAVTEADLKAFCRDNLTGYKRPSHYQFHDELPKSAVGKILRRELRDMDLKAS